MRTGAAVVLALLVLSAGSARAGTPLSESELDQVSAGGFSFVAPVVVTVPTTIVNIPINVNIFVDTTVSVNTAIGVCGYCSGTPGPTVSALNPVTHTVSFSAPQTNNFAPTIRVPTVSAPTVRAPTATVPPFFFRFP